MRQTTELERQKAALLKAKRAAIRLKHSIAADLELMEVLPEFEEEINDSLARGVAFEYELANVFLTEGAT